MKKLIGMTDYVLSETKDYFNDTNYEPSNLATNLEYYANFLKQPLTLGMFIPCDENGNILEEPIYTTDHSDDCYCYLCEKETKRCSDLQSKLQQAKSKVIFEGFEYDDSENSYIYLKNENTLIVYDICSKDFLNSDYQYIKNIEDLIPYNLTLTDKI